MKFIDRICDKRKIRISNKKEIQSRSELAEGFASVMNEYYNNGEIEFNVDYTNYGSGRYAAIKMLRKCDPDWIKQIWKEENEI